MEKRIPLKYFAYSITPSALAIEVMNGTRHHQLAAHLPLVDIKFDLENGNFILEGDWHFMMAANRHAEQSWYNCHRERVKIEASVYPAEIIDLADQRNDGLAFALDGTIQDGPNLGNCFGLLVFENIKRRNSFLNNEWNLTFYLYDAMNNECEIRLKLPVYAVSGNEQLS